MRRPQKSPIGSRLVIIDQGRYNEWEAISDYCYEHREWLEKTGRMSAMVLCMQKHWQMAVVDVPDDF